MDNIFSSQSSSKFDSRDRIFLELEQYGGVPDFLYFRDVMFYNVSVFAYAVPQVVSILSDLIWRPRLLQSEVRVCVTVVMYLLYIKYIMWCIFLYSLKIL